jgi:hypothetical protein
MGHFGTVSAMTVEHQMIEWIVIYEV